MQIDELNRVAVAQRLVLLIIAAGAERQGRQTLVPRARIDFAAHCRTCLRDGSFRRVYRMRYCSFMKLVRLLKPRLAVLDTHMANLRNGYASLGRRWWLVQRPRHFLRCLQEYRLRLRQARL